MHERGLNDYIVQLAERMRESANNLPDPNKMSEFDEQSLPEELKMFADVERFLHGKAKPISVITSIETQEFPQVNRMTDAQVTFLYAELTQLLNAFGFFADFPQELPIDIKYKLLRQKWDDEFVYSGSGMTHIEFCDYEPTRCPYPEKYCWCKDLDDFDDYDDSDDYYDDDYFI